MCTHAFFERHLLIFWRSLLLFAHVYTMFTIFNRRKPYFLKNQPAGDQGRLFPIYYCILKGRWIMVLFIKKYHSVMFVKLFATVLEQNSLKWLHSLSAWQMLIYFSRMMNQDLVTFFFQRFFSLYPPPSCPCPHMSVKAFSLILTGSTRRGQVWWYCKTAVSLTGLSLNRLTCSNI